MKFLLSATVALLIGAIGLSVYNMNDGVKNASPSELARLKTQLEEIRREQDALQRETQLRQLRESAATPIAQAPVATPVEDPSESAKLKAELAAKDLELKSLSEQKDKSDRDAKTFRDEAGLVGQRELEKNDNDLRRGRIVKEAMLVAKIKEHVQSAGFVTLEIIMPENVQAGMVLAVRKGTDIAAEVEVSTIEGNEAIANVRPGYTNYRPQAGDELVISPQ